MSVLRFATARALFDAFPELWEKVDAKPTDQPPIEFLKALASANKLPAAVTFCAFVLPRREAVWWACRSVKALSSENAAGRNPAFRAAEAWVYEPDDAHRQAALNVGTGGDNRNPTTWLALAAGWSGGFQMLGPNKQVPVPQNMTARAARIAVLTSAQKLAGPARQSRLQECIADGIKLAEAGL